MRLDYLRDDLKAVSRMHACQFRGLLAWMDQNTAPVITMSFEEGERVGWTDP